MDAETLDVTALVADCVPETVPVKGRVCEAVTDVVTLHEVEIVALVVKLSDRVLVCVRVGNVSEYVGDTVGESDHVSEGDGDTEGSEYVSEGRVFVIVPDTETVPVTAFVTVALPEEVAVREYEVDEEIVLLTSDVLDLDCEGLSDTEMKPENVVDSDVLCVREISELNVAERLDDRDEVSEGVALLDTGSVAVNEAVDDQELDSDAENVTEGEGVPRETEKEFVGEKVMSSVGLSVELQLAEGERETVGVIDLVDSCVGDTVEEMGSVAE